MSKGKDQATAAAVASLPGGEAGDLASNPVVQQMIRTAVEEALTLANKQPPIQASMPAPASTGAVSLAEAVEEMASDSTIKKLMEAEAAAIATTVNTFLAKKMEEYVDRLNKLAGERTVATPTLQDVATIYNGLDKAQKHALHRKLGVMPAPNGLWTCVVGHDFSLFRHGGWGIAAGSMNLGLKSLGVWKGVDIARWLIGMILA